MTEADRVLIADALIRERDKTIEALGRECTRLGGIVESRDAEIRRLKYALLDSTHAPRVARTVAELNELQHRTIGVDNRGLAVTVTQSAGEYARVSTGTSTVRGELWFKRGLGPITVLHIPEATK